MRMRIEELARRSGVTTRNIRAHQTAGLLPPPQLDGRTGWYGNEHLQRLEIIAELQARGFSLAAIRHTLDAWAGGGHLGHLLGLRQVLRAPIQPEEVGRLSSEELYARFPEARHDARLVERAEAQGLVHRRADGDFDVPSPLLLEAGRELLALGVGLGAVLDAVADVRRSLGEVADRFVGLVAPAVVERLLAEAPTSDEALAGEELSDQAADAIAIVQRLRPIALEVVRPFLAAELERAIDAVMRDAIAPE